MNRGVGAREQVLDGLREQTRRLVAELGGPLRRVRVRHGDVVVEIEWHGPAPAAHFPARAGAGASTADPAPPIDAARQSPIRSIGLPVPTPDEPVDPDSAATQRGEPTGVPPGVTAVVSPVVGTFYRAPEPGAPPFVTVGDQVVPGQVVGVVEVMKLMNEVLAERAGQVVELLVGDGEPVEYGQPLITLAPG